jgi:pyruvate/2-oxoglutarate/acetoin dehydrogenase E1 component
MRYLDSLNGALHELLARPGVYLIGEDVRDPYGGAFKVSRGLSSAYPDRVLTTPISEGAIAAIATGMALRGMRPIAEIMFADFLTLAFDQVLNHMTKYRKMYGRELPVPVVIRSPVGGGRGYGPTHSQTLERHFLGIPDLQVVVPSELHDPGRALRRAVEQDDPVLFLEPKILYPRELIDAAPTGPADWDAHRVHEEHAGAIVQLSNARGGPADLTIISWGCMFSAIDRAAGQLLLEDEITVELLMLENLTTVAWEVLTGSVARTGRALVVEESMGYLGLAAAIAGELSRQAFDGLRGPIDWVSGQDAVIPAARHLEADVLPDESDVITKVRSLCR